MPVIILAALSLLAAACGGSGGGTIPTPPAGKGSIAKNFQSAFADATFTVGSKQFTEQDILAQITIQALQAAGAHVKSDLNLVSSQTARQALVSGGIDMYWDYAGTGWSLYLNHATGVQGAMAQFQATARQDLERNGIKWLGPAALNDEYAIARLQNATGALGKVNTISQMARFVRQNPGQATFCGDAEYYEREFIPVETTYNFTFPGYDLTENANIEANYPSVTTSLCNFSEVFTTDARIQTDHLKVLTDDKGVFLTQLAALTVREKTFKQYPQLQAFARDLGSKLTQHEIISLNKMVDVDGKSAQYAAYVFLKSNGFIG
jgi:osmoprotectant transport system substrate-binding protein